MITGVTTNVTKYHNTTRLVWDCVFFGLLPPLVEKIWTGEVHYRPKNYWWHLQTNFWQAVDIMFHTSYTTSKMVF